MSELEEKSTFEEKPSETSTPINEALGKHRVHRREPWMTGVILIMIGLIFFARNYLDFRFDNWWALFILLPAFNSFERAWRAIQNAGGQLTASARGALIGGLVLSAVAFILFFGLDWVIFGPMLLIVAGVAVLLNAVLPK